ncbi:hypothetical protein RIF29_06624 [Crotalaria pallida]|uniref:Uncharacterized protein n=1 Tax=Crotalaria pallida TaxID=3830 RepID=A0AAN9J3D3_CROPI
MDMERFIQGDEEDPPSPAAANRWKRHLKDPSCVVGEHKHWYPLENDATLPLLLPLSLFGDVQIGSENQDLVDGVFILGKGSGYMDRNTIIVGACMYEVYYVR